MIRSVKGKRTATILFVILLPLLGLYVLNQRYHLFWNANTVNVTTASPLNPGKVKIEYGVSVNTINRPNDLHLFLDRNKYTVIYDGSWTSPVRNAYGENDFLITYDNQYYLSFRQFKFNENHQHAYNFHFYEEGEKVCVRVDIDGADDMEFERSMIPISAASSHVCNTPIERAGTIYNMVELTED